MTDHDHRSNPSNDHTNDPDADARVDALARAAAGELRRPAPADGVARIERARRRRQATQLGGAGVAVVAILAVGAFAIGGGDAGPTVVPATVSTVETTDTTTPETTAPATTVPDTAPDTTDTPPPTSEPPDTPGTVPPNAAGAPSVVYTSAQFASFGSEVSTVDPLTGEVISTAVLDEAASEESRAAQDALNGRTAMVPRMTGGSEGTARNGQVDAGWFTYEFEVGDLVYAYDIRPTEITDLDQFSTETLARFDRCGQSRVRVTGATDVALPEFASRVAVSADGRWVVTTSVACDEPGTLADGPSTVERRQLVTIFDAARPGSAGRVLADDVEPYMSALVTFSPDGDFVSIDASHVFDTSTGARIEVVPEGCDSLGTKWSRFIGPWIGDSSVALQVTCDGTWSLHVEDLATREAIDIAAPVDEIDFGLVADVDFAHYDRPSNVWFTMCVSDLDADTGTTTSTCWLGQGEGPLVELPDTAEASFLPLGFTYGG